MKFKVTTVDLEKDGTRKRGFTATFNIPDDMSKSDFRENLLDDIDEILRGYKNDSHLNGIEIVRIKEEWEGEEIE